MLFKNRVNVAGSESETNQWIRNYCSWYYLLMSRLFFLFCRSSSSHSLIWSCVSALDWCLILSQNLPDFDVVLKQKGWYYPPPCFPASIFIGMQVFLSRLCCFPYACFFPSVWQTKVLEEQESDGSEEVCISYFSYSSLILTSGLQPWLDTGTW